MKSKVKNMTDKARQSEQKLAAKGRDKAKELTEKGKKEGQKIKSKLSW